MNKLFVLVSLLLTAGAVHAAKVPYAFQCAYSNDGFGGDEGYEIELRKSGADKNSYVAALTFIDPGGGRVYAKVPVKKSLGKSGLEFKGEDFLLEVNAGMPKTKDGFVFANYDMLNESGGKEKGPTLCHGPELGNDW